MLWIKAFHVIAMTAWFGGLFYLPRLFVYHAAARDAISIARFKIMEKKLYWYIATPAALLTLVLGITLMSFNKDYYLHQLWLHLKLSIVVLLIVYHVYLGMLLQQFKLNQNRHSTVFYRILNEVPVLFLISIIILVIVKPFGWI